MAIIQDISVSIVRGTKALSKKGFGLPLILGTMPERTGEYQEFNDLVAVSKVYPEMTDEYKMAAVMFAQNPCPAAVAIYSRGSEPILEALDALNETNPGFYAIVIPERDALELNNAAQWADKNGKLFFGCTSESEFLLGRKRDREVFVIHDKPGMFPECAWVAQNLPKDPGGVNWEWKTLNGQIASAYTTTQLNEIKKVNGQAIAMVKGSAVINNGTTTSGENIEVIRGRDWIKAKIEEGICQLYLENDLITLDTVGIIQIESVIRAVLKEAGQKGIIARAVSQTDQARSDDKEFMYQVLVPGRDELTAGTDALKSMQFRYVMTGARNSAEVIGKITA